MSIADDKTPELWCGLMPRRKEVLHPLTTDLLCLQVFDASLEFKGYNQDTIFDKWAALEVDNFDAVPADMETYTLSGFSYTKAQLQRALPPSNTSTKRGYQPQITYLITEPSLKYWVRNIKTTTRLQRRKSGYP